MIEDGVIVPPSHLEVIVADHCMTSCRQCNHGSPVLRKWNADPDEIARDLARLGRVFRPRIIKLIGGEPLLHPNILELIRVVRDSGFAGHLLLATNGMLLDRLPEAAWRLLSEVEVSLYPASPPGDGVLAQASTRARASGTRLTTNTYPRFRRTFTARRNEDDALVHQIFAACKIANFWVCCGLYRGRIYRCPQSMYASKLAGVDLVEGIAISDEPGFRDDLLAFLNSSEPLASCRYCVGTVGRKQAHRRLTRPEWRSDLEEPAAQMIDRDLLARSLVRKNPVDDCKTPVGGWTRPRLRSKLRAGLNRLRDVAGL